MSQPGNELAELLWENGPAPRWTAAPAPFPPFSCSAARTTKVQELGKHPASATTMAQGDHEDALPWLHYPIIGVDNGDSEYCGILPQYYDDIESALVPVQTNRLRSTPLFSEQRMAWLQPPKEAPAPPPLAPPVPVWHAAEPAAALPQRLQPEVKAPATTTTLSVCSDNDDRRQLKRSSTGQMDLDDEAGGQRRSAARSTKRGRTTEGHNMSERRRRDRINEKMRALQELIPNCNNKIDKASMLEEAIEYMKTLQLQVQMMSTMGTGGLCVPPMLAMPHMQMPPMAHFHYQHHLGAMGFGMGALDPRLVPYVMVPGVPMFHQAKAAAAEGAYMAAGTVTSNAATAQAEQTPSDHLQVPRPM